MWRSKWEECDSEERGGGRGGEGMCHDFHDLMISPSWEQCIAQQSTAQRGALETPRMSTSVAVSNSILILHCTYNLYLYSPYSYLDGDQLMEDLSIH